MEKKNKKNQDSCNHKDMIRILMDRDNLGYQNNYHLSLLDTHYCRVDTVAQSQ